MLFASCFLSDRYHCSWFKGEQFGLATLRYVAHLRFGTFSCLRHIPCLRLLCHLLPGMLTWYHSFFLPLNFTSGFFLPFQLTQVSAIGPSLCSPCSETKRWKHPLHLLWFVSLFLVPHQFDVVFPFYSNCLPGKTVPIWCYQWNLIAHVFILFLTRLKNNSSSFLPISHVCICVVYSRLLPIFLLWLYHFL